jgi:translation initiation factor 2B subunit (eIF-2B alpha/beta/delta family)
VLAALVALRARIAQVVGSEGRPLLEGRLLAERLAAQQVPITVLLDAELPDAVGSADLVVVGADAVFPDAYVNKVGTRLLQERARAARKPFFVLADTAKILPPALAALHRIEDKPLHEIWRDAPAGVTVVNRYFERVPLGGAALLTERGELSTAKLRAWAARQPVARRWKDGRK